MNAIFNLKLAYRAIVRRPAVSLVVVLTLAIATSTSIVVFSYIDSLLLTPLPFKDPDQLVRIQSVKGGEKGLLSYPEFLDMQKELVSIEELAVYRDGGRYNLSGDGKPPEELTTTFASSNLFQVLGVEPVIGSYWPATLDKRRSHTVMLTHEFWKRRFDGNENVAGLDITLDGFSYTNYGVLPEGFSFPNRNEAFRAAAFAEFVIGARDFRPSIGLARLKPGVSLEAFNEELRTFGDQQEQRHLHSNLGVSFVAEPLSELFIGDLKGYLLLLGAAALFLLMIGGVNVSNLILSQAIRRRRETIVRKVLGSSNLSIIKDFVTHSFLLSLVGSLLGLVLAWYLLEVSYALVSPYLPYWVEIKVNPRILLYTLTISLLLGITTGLVPWLFHFSRSNLVDGLKDGLQTTGSRGQHRLQKGLAGLQIFVSVLLLIGGGLLLKSFDAAQEADLGFETNQTVTFRIALSWYKYGSPEKKRAFFQTSQQQIAAISGVQEVAINSVLPLTDIVKTSVQAQALFSIEGQSEVEISNNPFVSIQQVTPNYFEVMDIAIDQGVGFDPGDIASHQHQVVIDQQLAERMWPGEYALGKRIKLEGLGGPDAPYLTIVGVANNVKHQSITRENLPCVYVSLLYYTTTDGHYVVKSTAPMSELQPKLSEAILSIDQNQPTFEYMEMTDRVEEQNWQSRVSSFLFLAIAVFGSIIAAIGLFSTITFVLILRIKELALRRVLGATDGNVLQLVMKDMLRISGWGIAAGLLLSPILLRPIAPFLFGVGLIDSTTYFTVTGALLLISVVAVMAPSWRALFINPVTVLRKD